jgi:hypothetical protein
LVAILVVIGLGTYIFLTWFYYNIHIYDGL